MVSPICALTVDNVACSYLRKRRGWVGNFFLPCFPSLSLPPMHDRFSFSLPIFYLLPIFYSFREGGWSQPSLAKSLSFLSCRKLTSPVVRGPLSAPGFNLAQIRPKVCVFAFTNSGPFRSPVFRFHFLPLAFLFTIPGLHGRAVERQDSPAVPQPNPGGGGTHPSEQVNVLRRAE